MLETMHVILLVGNTPALPLRDVVQLWRADRRTDRTCIATRITPRQHGRPPATAAFTDLHPLPNERAAATRPCMTHQQTR